MQLREAATRRKIQALKNQLGHHHGEDGASHTPPEATSESQVQSTFSDQQVASSSPSITKCHMTSSTTPKSHITSPDTPKSHVTTPKNHIISTPVTPPTCLKTTPTSHMTSPAASQGSPATLKHHMTPPAVPKGHETSPTTPQYHMTAPKGHVTFPAPAEKLTVSKEVKETGYMTEVQRQRVRVSRIRRCIASATIIQRAWRQYRTQLRGY